MAQICVPASFLGNILCRQSDPWKVQNRDGKSELGARSDTSRSAYEFEPHELSKGYKNGSPTKDLFTFYN